MSALLLIQSSEFITSHRHTLEFLFGSIFIFSLSFILLELPVSFLNIVLHFLENNILIFETSVIISVSEITMSLSLFCLESMFSIFFCSLQCLVCLFVCLFLTCEIFN